MKFSYSNLDGSLNEKCGIKFDLSRTETIVTPAKRSTRSSSSWIHIH